MESDSSDIAGDIQTIIFVPRDDIEGNGDELANGSSSDFATSVDEASEITPLREEAGLDFQREISTESTDSSSEANHSLQNNMINFIYDRQAAEKTYFSPIWYLFKEHYPNVELSPIELKLYFFNVVLKNIEQYSFLTEYQQKYFHINFKKSENYNEILLRNNDLIEGKDYKVIMNMDELVEFQKLTNQSKCVVVPKNFPIGTFREGTSDLFKMSTRFRYYFSIFLRNQTEIENNVILEDDEIRKRLKIYLQTNQNIPNVRDMLLPIHSVTPEPNVLQNVQSKTKRSATRKTTKHQKPQTPSIVVSRASIEPPESGSSSGASTIQDPSFLSSGILSSTFKSNVIAKKKRDTRSIKRLLAPLRNPRLVEMEKRIKSGTTLAKIRRQQKPKQ